MEFALLHSPFLPPSSLLPLARALEAGGQFATALSASEALDNEEADYDGVSRAIAAQLTRPCALVAHSGAGGLVPSIVTAAGGRIRHAIFVDAILPHDGRSWLDTAPEALSARVRELSEGGRAPRWSSWLPDPTLRRLLPNEAYRDRLVSEMPCIPMRFLECPAPTIPDWLTPECRGYVQLSAGYAAESERSSAMGWGNRRLDGDHLWFVTRPEEVAKAIVDLASAR